LISGKVSKINVKMNGLENISYTWSQPNPWVIGYGKVSYEVSPKKASNASQTKLNFYFDGVSNDVGAFFNKSFSIVDNLSFGNIKFVPDASTLTQNVRNQINTLRNFNIFIYASCGNAKSNPNENEDNSKFEMSFIN
jgi:hypothetical protein